MWWERDWGANQGSGWQWYPKQGQTITGTSRKMWEMVVLKISHCHAVEHFLIGLFIQALAYPRRGTEIYWTPGQQSSGGLHRLYHISAKSKSLWMRAIPFSKHPACLIQCLRKQKQHPKTNLFSPLWDRGVRKYTAGYVLCYVTPSKFSQLASCS